MIVLRLFCFQKQAAKKDVFQVFSEKVRDHKDLVSRWAVLQETRVEYFRGKDFVSFMKNHPELKDILESDKNLETEDIANILLGKNLLVRCDRVVKTVRPGKKKLSTWPAHLEIFPVSTFYFWLEPSYCELLSCNDYIRKFNIYVPACGSVDISEFFFHCSTDLFDIIFHL